MIPTLIMMDSIDDHLSRFRQAGFEPVVAPDAARRRALIEDFGQDIRAVVTRGSIGLGKAEISLLPRLEIICALGAGYERIDLAAALERNIVLTYGPGLNAVSVADHAMALLLSAVRDIPASDTSVKRGHWDRRVRCGVSGARMGILGLGAIGRLVAQRACAGFGMPVAYCGRGPKADCAYAYHPDPVALALASDFLVVAAPGGAATHHLVDDRVLDALGPQGYLVNVARGSVVDTRALIAALRQRRIAGAALDVIEGEPDVAAEVLDCPNLILTPHVAGRSPHAVRATVEQVIDNLVAHFSGKPVMTPIPVPQAG